MTEEKSKVEGRTIGIDLGTTFSAVAVMEGGKPTIITNSEGERTTPSVVSIKEGETTVGQVARNQAITDPKHIVRSVKRHMGDSSFKVNIEDKDYTAQEVSAKILQKLKRDAEAYLGGPVKNAVITVPAYFNDSQRQATKDAGEIAGLNVLRIVNEPTAASLAYGLDKQEKVHTALVFDFGGGTFDVSVLELGEGVFEVKSTSGDNHLGGDDVDEIIMDYVAKDFKNQQGVDLKTDAAAMQRLKEACEKAKKELSSKTQVTINIPYITVDDKGPKHVNMDLNRAKFEELIADILRRLEEPTKKAIDDAKDVKVDKVLFVGGSTRIPAVQKIVKDILSLDGDKSINPDEAVALGAAIQAGVLAGDVKDVLLLDVTPLTLGIETLGGVRTALIERNTTIPAKKSQVFSTAADNQTAVTINVLQGERPMAADNVALGRFDLVGIPPAPRGMPQIEVTFDIDANGIVHVGAKDLGTGKEQKIQVTGSSNLNKDDIEKMRKDAESHAEDDKKKLEEVEVMNQADTIIFSTEKSLKEFGDKVDKAKIKPIQDKVEELKKLKEKKDIAAMKTKIEEINTALQEIGKEIYEKVQKEQAAKQAKEGKKDDKKEKPKGDDVVDAEYKEVKDEKKA